MPRLFIGVALPPRVARPLARLGAGIPGARWEPVEKLHVTLRFLGDLDHAVARRIAESLDRVDHPTFTLGLRGIGVFPPRGQPRILWAGVDDAHEIGHLRQAIDRALAPLGLPPERRKFHAHVTLARLNASPEARVAAFMTENALLSIAGFPVAGFTLFSSVLAPGGSKYRVEAEFDLDEPV